MVRQYGSFSAWSFSLPLLLMASSLLSVVSFAMEGRKLGTPSSMEEIKIPTFAKRHVTITNDLVNGADLKIHCKSKDNDLGTHILQFHNKFSWEFRTIPFVHKTLFYCYMWWGNVNGSFDIYKADRDDDRCTDCQWSIRTDGIYSLTPKTNRFEIMYRWPLL